MLPRRLGPPKSGVFFPRGFNQHKKCAGFTLIEVLVSIGIMGVLSTITIVNFQAAQRLREVRNTAETLVSDLRRAQTMTLSGRKLPDGRIARGGYGIFLNPPSQYILFAEEPFSGSPPAFSSIDGWRAGGNYYDVATVNLPSNITMAVSGGMQYIDFAPPRAVPCFTTNSSWRINTSTPSGTSETIFVCDTGSPVTATIRFELQGKTREVFIDRRSGQISTQ